MYSEARKLHLIEEVLKIESDAVLAEIEAVVKKAMPPKKSAKANTKTGKLRGALNLTQDQYKDFNQHIKDTRNEWERDI